MGLKAQEKVYGSLLSSLRAGGVHVVTGKNGTGKSRFFKYASESIAKALNGDGSQFDRMICLSGTMHDKYPRSIYMGKSKSDAAVYLGNKVNNNMVSDISPFRTLVNYILDPKHVVYDNISLLFEVFEKVSFEGRMVLKFRYGKGKKSDAIDAIGSELEVEFHSLGDSIRYFNLFEEHIANGNILLSDILFSRNGKWYGLAELSSGEKQYILTLLGCLFCSEKNSILFYDEPENSLHPSWQSNIVRDLVSITTRLHSNTTMLIATHSPLIASSIRNEGSYLCDFPSGQSWSRVKLYGKTSDAVLRDQFHLFSARSPEVAVLVSSCLKLITENEQDSQEFREKRRLLESLDLDLSQDDPLVKIIGTILGF
ncbi:AAA family ATPase [Halomonas garicola]|uniref:AAA family ATPase n=1 Tax=Halomonas garicola TaxID=1690008 RepID=UPI00289CA941|nr:AAA family ATPase [Halomonas garicola]